MALVEPIGGGKLKDRILTILSIDYPLSAKKIFNRLKNDFQISITYQAVYKAIREMVESNILLSENKEYKISLEWLNQLENFSEKIKKTYSEKPLLIRGVKVISFDLDGCLSDNTFDEMVWRTKIPQIYAKERKMSFEKAFEEVTSEYKRLWGKVSGWRDVEFWFKHFHFKATWQETVEDLKRHIKRYGDVLPVLSELKKHFSLIIISHADRKFLKLKLQVNNLEHFIDKSFSTTSDFNEYHKTTEVFLTVCKKMKITPGQMIHIGDSFEYDYKIPSSLGIRSFLIDRVGTEKADYIVRDLFEFKDKILK